MQKVGEKTDSYDCLSASRQSGPSSRQRAWSSFTGIITCSKQMFSLFRYINAIAGSCEPVLITGESGVGKELIAGAVHKASGRTGKFVAINIAGLDDSILSDTLFGHTRGSFTGADKGRRGLLETACNGTLFLDEIGDMRIESQLKLLRILQENEYYPLGADKPMRSTARIVTATNCDLKTLGASRGFRKDLFYRLKIHHVHIPPLRERREDIPLLLEHFTGESSRRLNKNPMRISSGLYPYFNAYPFPGNVREFRSLIFDAVAFNQSGELTPEDFNLNFSCTLQDNYLYNPPSPSGLFEQLTELPTIKEATTSLIDTVLNRTQGIQVKAARILGISPQALSKRLKNIQNL